ncbi:MAG: IS66 family insertion sequence element accessory protein TnpB, partial [Bacteroidales bacterium]
MRKGINGLYNVVKGEMELSPVSGDVFIFFSKTRKTVKLLKWDDDGFILYQKRLEDGSFEVPRFNR